MKFSCVIIFICPLVIVSAMATIELMQRTFKSCDPDQWIMTNTLVEWKNRTKIISCNITYKELNNSTIYKIHIMIGCEDISSNCTNEPTVQINNIKCDSQNLSLSDMDACTIGNELGKWQKRNELLKYRYGLIPGEMLSRMVFCITINNVNGTEYEYF